MIRDDVVYCDECGGSICADQGAWLAGRVVCGGCLGLLVKAAGVPPSQKRARPIQDRGYYALALIALLLSICFGGLALIAIVQGGGTDLVFIALLLCVIVALLAILIMSVSSYFRQLHLKDSQRRS